VPGSAEKIIDSVYGAPERRQADLTTAEIKAAKTGQVASIALAFVCIGAAVAAFVADKSYAVALFLGVPFIQLIQQLFPPKRLPPRPDGD